ncbi:hypothetical protein QBC44DRAFT_36359 [Cladorrhinum sp. PSN332]|nr:hypothetical protein QBC44DRAFT_36359 [Cladorrhinum sp. PSN332]
MGGKITFLRRHSRYDWTVGNILGFFYIYIFFYFPYSFFTAQLLSVGGIPYDKANGAGGGILLFLPYIFVVFFFLGAFWHKMLLDVLPPNSTKDPFSSIHQSLLLSAFSFFERGTGEKIMMQKFYSARCYQGRKWEAMNEKNRGG